MCVCGVCVCKQAKIDGEKVCAGSEAKRVWMKVGGSGGEAGRRWEEEEMLQSCRFGCTSSRNCSLPCWDHLTVLSPSTES